MNLVPYGLICFAGCEPGHPGPAREYRGPFYTSPKYGAIVSVPTGMETTKALEWVDIRIEQWIIEKDSWGCGGFSDEHLAAVARSLPIFIFSGYYVPADGSGGVNGWTYYEVRIEVAERDSIIGISTLSSPIDELPALPHELTHLVLGSFHH